MTPSDTLAIAFFGYLLGFFSSWFIESRKQRYDYRKETRERLLSKYEQLYVSLGASRTSCHSLMIEMSKSLRDDMDMKKLDIIILEVKRLEIKHNEISMLIKFYVPKLEDQFDILQKKTADFIMYIADIEGEKNISILKNHASMLEETIDKLQSDLDATTHRLLNKH